MRATGATHTTSTEAKHNNNKKSCDNIGDSATSTKPSIREGQQEATVIAVETQRKSTALDYRTNQKKAKNGIWTTTVLGCTGNRQLHISYLQLREPDHYQPPTCH
jgi:hypothetical protein